MYIVSYLLNLNLILAKNILKLLGYCIALLYQRRQFRFIGAKMGVAYFHASLIRNHWILNSFAFIFCGAIKVWLLCTLMRHIN